jgi:hypothetical protein
LDCFIDIAPAPLEKQAEERLIKPDEKAFSGFVFKIHANMDPHHRDRLAFIKIVSGTFKRNTPYLHVRNNKKVKFPPEMSQYSYFSTLKDPLIPDEEKLQLYTDYILWIEKKNNLLVKKKYTELKEMIWKIPKSENEVSFVLDYVIHLLTYQKENPKNMGWRITVELDTLAWIIRECRKILKKEPNLVELEAPINVLGDIHG